jgi:gamma-glutamyltranspeptidase/glutathione hydrolase
VLFVSGLAWFDARAGAANSVAPGKRPLVNMAPLLLLKDGRRLAVGAAGGRRIISAVTQVVSAVVDHGLELQEAASAPRIDAGEPRIRLSDRLPPGTDEGLRALGHDVVTVAEQHAPFSYELARAALAGIDEAGLRSGGIHPFARGFVAGR